MLITVQVYTPKLSKMSIVQRKNEYANSFMSTRDLNRPSSIEHDNSPQTQDTNEDI